MALTDGLRDDVRRVAAAAAAVVLASAGLLGSAAPVGASQSVPWRFAPLITANESIAGYDFAHDIRHTGDFYLQCPQGYIPASGGVIAGAAANYLARLLEWPDTTAGGYYHITLINEAVSQVDFTLAVSCVWADNVGTISLTNVDFPRNNAGRAGGSILCPAGQTPLNVGFDWSVYTARSVNFSSPITSGTTQGTGWYVAGYSDHSGATLGVELRCVSASLLSSEYATANDTSGSGAIQVVATCAAGYRILTGGAAPPFDQTNPGVDQGWAVSGPYDPRQYPAFGASMPVTLRSMALCVPSSTVSAQITGKPSDPSATNIGTFTFNAVDSVGETAPPKCYIDGVQHACSSSSTYNYGPLLDGIHTFTVTIQNQYGAYAYDTDVWTVDTTAPLVASHSPTSNASLTGALTIAFSEPVTGVSTSSVTVHAQHANVDVAGTIGHPTSSSATWTPKSRLVPGETYRFTFTSAIHDTAGNALTPTFFDVRALTTVDNTSPAVLEYWDLDNNALASGGSYISSNLSGARADLTFTASAGQMVSVYGIRLPSGGYADVYLDGAKVATASFYATTTGRARVYLSGALAAGSHTISIRPTGTKPSASTGTWVGLDNALIGATIKQESSFNQHFRRTSSTSAYSGSYDVMTHMTDGDAAPRYQVTVVGTGIQLYATKSTTSGSARIYVDGVLKATVSFHATSTVYKALVYSTTFTNGVHVIQVQAVGTSTGANSSIDLDRLTVS